MDAAQAARSRSLHEEALGHVEAALRLDRRDPGLLLMAGQCEEALGRLDAAAARYRRALQLDPNDWLTLCRLGYCERLRGRADASVVALMRATLLRPDSADTHNELALALVQAGRRAEAIASLRRALAIDPGSAPARRNLAKLLYVAHAEGTAGEAVSAAQALAALEAALQADPGDAELRHLAHALRGERVARPPGDFVERFFDRFAPGFEAKVAELDYRAPAVAAAMLGPRLAARSPGPIVDLGCGTGLAAGLLRPAARTLVGVDLSGEMLARARARGLYDELHRQDIGAYLAARPPASIDCAVALDVFIYVGDLAPVIPACAAALAPGGLLAFTVEVLDGEGDFALRASGRFAHALPHVRALCEASGLAWLEAREFDIRTEAGRGIPAALLAFAKPG